MKITMADDPTSGASRRPLRILEVETFGRGGLIHYVYNLSCALADRGHDVTLVTAAAYELDGLALPPRVRVVKAIARVTHRLRASLPARALGWAVTLEALADAVRRGDPGTTRPSGRRAPALHQPNRVSVPHPAAPHRPPGGRDGTRRHGARTDPRPGRRAPAHPSSQPADHRPLRVRPDAPGRGVRDRPGARDRDRRTASTGSSGTTRHPSSPRRRGAGWASMRATRSRSSSATSVSTRDWTCCSTRGRRSRRRDPGRGSSWPATPSGSMPRGATR